ncbi:PiT family inorganic phosphate transporter [Methanohalophilus levihalophilus]|uniref:inorganic phosphate transporter n=1 Tax=Methanohalophilus levihalophilus TaxID=1431282 RepID=UPI001AE411D2|nr:inorganic phosphate transporter [Methanohalophilus levihalophilus]MBP2030132.1 PiT family inorganic phosphate transporter [Methanohalophilus levihalophilus]
MDIFDPFIIILVLAGLYMAWNIGANDLANAMGTSVGSGALTLKQVIIIAAIFEFIGAVFFGNRVTTTIAKGIVPLDAIKAIDPHLVVLGMLAAILAAGFWITFATFYNLPVSTTHSIVGAVLGFGIVASFMDIIVLSEIKWAVMAKIVGSWLFSPVLGAILAYALFSLIRFLFLQRADNPHTIEKKFVYLQIIAACYIAFAHGSNDVANAVGPIYAGLNALAAAEGAVPIWVLAVGGAGMVLGLGTWGYRVIETIGTRITELTPTRGFAAQFATASVVILHSYSSLPISTTHTLVGSVIGVGLAGGLAAVDLSVIGKIIASWIITVPVAALTSAAIFALLLGVGI